MKIQSFKDLFIWQKGHLFVIEIYKLTRSFPVEEKFGLVSQIRRSSASICANVAEGYTKSTKDFARFLEIARGSLEETKYYLILSKDLGYCSEQEFNKLFNQVDEVGRMTKSLIQKLRIKFKQDVD